MIRIMRMMMMMEEQSFQVPFRCICHVMSYLLYLAASTSHMFIQEAREVSTTT